MASAQVLPNSRKQGHMEAGKRMLEEFRKKRAAEKAKKSASATPVTTSTAVNNDKPLLDAEIVRGQDSDGVVSSIGDIADNQQRSVEITTGGNSSTFPPINKLGSNIDPNVQADPSVNGIDPFDSDAAHTNGTKSAYKMHEGLGSPADFSYPIEGNYLKNGLGLSRASSGFSSDQSIAVTKQGAYVMDGLSSDFSFPVKVETLPRENSGGLKNIMSAATNFSMDMNANVFSVSSGSLMAPEKLGVTYNSPSYFSEDYTPHSTSATGYVEESIPSMLSKSQFDGTLDFQDRKHNSAFSGLLGMEGAASQMRDHSSKAFYSTFSSSPNHLPLHSSNSETLPRRSRPSFLDSLNVPRASPGYPLKSTPSEESVNSSNFNGLDTIESSATSRYSSDTHLAAVSKPPQDLSEFPTVAPGSSVYINSIQGQRSNFNELNMDNKLDFLRPKPNEDFSALEQHIEDLTQEKFSLQRALEASRTLAESLAAENTSLTDSYNQQRNAVNQLKEDMEKLQEEINAQLADLEAIKNVYANAQLECNAADERAKLLASEVIGLEEKALRLRSNELKLERQLENSHAEISSFRKKVSSLERERQDLQSTISALQEEKKMLQSKVRKASNSGNSVDMNMTGIKRKEMSTSTEDLDMNTEQGVAARLLDGSEASSFSLSDGRQINVEAASAYIPDDQMRIIVNINTLISELTFEKEELLKALESEKADNVKVKGLNKELSRKLETQTQRLELLTLQSMVPENLTTRLHDTPAMIENTPYADEGDEVVERVLGWIMKLFPGGPSRRRPGKHL
ncbi:hypothetical protein MLD38_036249 [Melastoma candidum]|uniref:Uncharacterized protein n=1 Tax=Melastoma candidum TaxID=119954 RepID=A0ACB9LKZ3_9MYRT|nr:hypothetical protein MLD38_036249 [Melastoma candidum]